MGISLKNKVVLITGASAGIGAATAMEFAKLGARLLLCARRHDRLHKLEPSLLAAGAASVFSFELDVQSRNSVDMAFQTLPDAWSEIDILVKDRKSVV